MLDFLFSSSLRLLSTYAYFPNISLHFHSCHSDSCLYHPTDFDFAKLQSTTLRLKRIDTVTISCLKCLSQTSLFSSYLNFKSQLKGHRKLFLFLWLNKFSFVFPNILCMSVPLYSGFFNIVISLLRTWNNTLKIVRMKLILVKSIKCLSSFHFR